MANIPFMRFFRWYGYNHPQRNPERFSYGDINRINNNTNQIAAFIGQPTKAYKNMALNSIVEHPELNKLESHQRDLAAATDTTLNPSPVTTWAEYRNITFVDMDRWEKSSFDIYRKLSGAGLRQDSERVETIRVYASDWVKDVNGVWTVEVFSRIVKADSEGVLGFSTWDGLGTKRTVTVLSPSIIAVADNKITLRANGIIRVYDMDLELHIFGSDDMIESRNFILTAANWTPNGDGTFGQNITYPGVTPTTEGLTGFQVGTTGAARFEAQDNFLRVSSQGVNTITYQSTRQPTLDYPIEVKIFAWSV